MPASITLEGLGLHGGQRAIVRLARADRGPVVVRSGGAEAPREELAVVPSVRSTTIALAQEIHVATVEHLFAAFGGLGIQGGVIVDVEGAELPLLDGGARRWAEELAGLDLPAAPPPLVIVERGEVTIAGSVYSFTPGDHPSVEVAVDFGDARLAGSATWHGDAADFVGRIAPARTFGFEHEVNELLERGLASHVAPESVVVIAREGILSAGAPFEPDEPARHKLLDLVGDLWIHGGPPRGLVRATRPGHAATHAAMAKAFERGIVAASR